METKLRRLERKMCFFCILALIPSQGPREEKDVGEMSRDGPL
jgi:hypothetical protein